LVGVTAGCAAIDNYEAIAIGAICGILVVLFILKRTMGLRVSEKEEVEGLDIHEHGMEAYPDFRLNDH